jgi:hypothetical protein
VEFRSLIELEALEHLVCELALLTEIHLSGTNPRWGREGQMAYEMG